MVDDKRQFAVTKLVAKRDLVGPYQILFYSTTWEMLKVKEQASFTVNTDRVHNQRLSFLYPLG